MNIKNIRIFSKIWAFFEFDEENFNSKNVHLDFKRKCQNFKKYSPIWENCSWISENGCEIWKEKRKGNTKKENGKMNIER